ncbi:MAG: YhbY family RNA-binding protein [Phycisphaerae bacterium]|nr:YhbY family RNA-binding protein [Phycisphaerae bacterium]
MTNDGETVKLTAAERRALAARGNRLRARLVVGRRGLGESIVAQVRRALEKTDLVKVRVDADAREEVDAIAEQLAREVPCHFIQRVGKVVLLYQRPSP